MNSSFVRGKVSYDMVDTAHRAEGDFELGTFICGTANQHHTSTTSVRQP
jgi:hypothetical protein